jgi:hypothetical protein
MSITTVPSSTETMPVVLLEGKPIAKGSLRDFAAVRLGRWLVIRDLGNRHSNGRAWVGLPGKPIITHGTARRDFQPCVLLQREGDLAAFAAPPRARGLNFRTAQGVQWSLLRQRGDGDAARLREIQVAPGYRQRWVRYTVQEAAEKRTTVVRGST